MALIHQLLERQHEDGDEEQLLRLYFVDGGTGGFVNPPSIDCAAQG